MQTNSLFPKHLLLPNDIIYIILEYAGIMKNRRGKYMTQIPSLDSRYDILRTISIPIINRYYENVYFIDIQLDNKDFYHIVKITYNTILDKKSDIIIDHYFINNKQNNIENYYYRRI